MVMSSRIAEKGNYDPELTYYYLMISTISTCNKIMNVCVNSTTIYASISSIITTEQEVGHSHALHIYYIFYAEQN